MTEQLVSSLWLSSRGAGTFREREFARSRYLRERYLRTCSDFPSSWNGLLWKLEGEYFVGEITRTSQASLAETFGRKLLDLLDYVNSLLSAARSRETSPYRYSQSDNEETRCIRRHFGRALGTVTKVCPGWGETRRKVQRAVRSSGEKPDISHNYWRCLPEAAWDSRE